MTRYCVGFMFSRDEKYVLLIQKNKPDWQKGKLNGIGGKCEENETSATAMQREFSEETGINRENWKYIISMFGSDWHCDVFTCISDDIFKHKTLEYEKVVLLKVSELKEYKLISNLYWLIPMCLDKNDDHKSGINYNLSNQVQIK